MFSKLTEGGKRKRVYRSGLYLSPKGSQVNWFAWGFFEDLILLFIRERHTERERQRDRETERQRHRQREKQAPCREPDMGLSSGSPGLDPGLKVVLNC